MRHHVLAPRIEEAFTETYKEVWQRSAGELYKHAQEKGWNRTLFQCYFNNKPRYGYSLWTLDEPNVYRDWEALNFYARLFKKAIADPEIYTTAWHNDYFTKGLQAMKRKRPSFVFRGDISRPQMQGTLSDGLFTMMYIGGAVFGDPRTVKEHKYRMPAFSTMPSLSGLSLQPFHQRVVVTPTRLQYFRIVQVEQLGRTGKHSIWP